MHSAAVPFTTSHGNVRNYTEPKTIFLRHIGMRWIFFIQILLSRITYRALVEMLLELGNLTPGHLHNIPGQVHALIMVTRVKQQPPAHHPLEALL